MGDAAVQNIPPSVAIEVHGLVVPDSPEQKGRPDETTVPVEPDLVGGSGGGHQVQHAIPIVVDEPAHDDGLNSRARRGLQAPLRDAPNGRVKNVARPVYGGARARGDHLLEAVPLEVDNHPVTAEARHFN